MREYGLSSELTLWNGSTESLLTLCETRLAEGRPVHVCTVNPEINEIARADRTYREAVQRADVRTIDGIGIALAVWARHGVVPRRLTGVALVHTLACWAARERRELMIVGAREASRARAEERLRELGVLVPEGYSPTVGPDGAIGACPERALPRGGVVLVALGAPKQEFWIRAQMEAGAPPNVFVGVGGAVDYLSGETQLPPAWVRRVGLEWLFRLLREPRKRFRRQRTSLFPFVRRELIAPLLQRLSVGRAPGRGA